MYDTASRHARGYGSAWTRLRVSILRRDAGLCQVCAARGIVREGSTVDHVINKASGGTDDSSNLRVICDECHAAKTAREALAGRGIINRRPRASCDASGMPTDPLHPWVNANESHAWGGM